MKKFLIEYESSRWAGAGNTCVVNAMDSEQAADIAADFMEEDMCELYADEDEELRDEQGADVTEDMSYSITSIEEFNETHEAWGWYQDPVQSQFYPEVN